MRSFRLKSARTKPRVLFIEAPYKEWPMMIRQPQPPTGLLAVASYAEWKGYDVAILDCVATRKSWKELADIVRAHDPDIVGVTAISRNIYEAMYTAHIVKSISKDIIVVAGGEHPSALPKLTLDTCPDIDLIVIGEGEITFHEILEKLSNGGTLDPQTVKGLAFYDGPRFITTPRRPLIEDLDSLPMPSYHLLPNEKYAWDYIGPDGTGFATSRGCLFNCKFCSETVFWEHKWRGRSGKLIADEFQLLREEYGRRSFWIYDAEFFIDQNRNREFVEEMKKRSLDVTFLVETRATTIIRDKEWLGRYHDVGLRFAIVGMESATDQILSIYDKRNTVENTALAARLLNRHGIILQGQLVFGEWHDNLKTLEATYKFVREKIENPSWVTLLVLTPFPGTRLWDEALAEGRILEFDFSKYDYIYGIMPTQYLSPEEVEACVEQFNQRITGNFMRYKDSPESMRTIFTIYRQLGIIAVDKLTCPVDRGFSEYKNWALKRQLELMGRDEKYARCLEKKEKILKSLSK